MTHVRFTTDVSASLTADTLHLENATTHTDLPAGNLSLSYDHDTDIATWTVINNPTTGTNCLPYGWYVATINKEDVHDANNVCLQQDLSLSCPVLAGSFTYASARDPGTLI